MKAIERFKQKAVILACGALLSLGVSSCESIYDKTQDCDPYFYLNFVYDMNMDYADAFSEKVNSVEVFVFDNETGELVGKFKDSGAALQREGYKMRLYLEPGNYDFITWCGLEDNEDHFLLTDNVRNQEDIFCRMGRERNSEGLATQDKKLHSLFYGKISAKLEDKPGDHVYTVPLIKDTNNINFSLQDISGKELDPKRFTVKLHINNGLMAFDNTVLDDEEIECIPYYQAWGTASVGSKADDEITRHDIVVAEMSTARLIAEHDPYIQVIDNNQSETVYSIPLVKWILMSKSEEYSYMDDQEYLDRVDDYNVILYVNGDTNRYIAIAVEINSWKLVLKEDEELH